MLMTRIMLPHAAFNFVHLFFLFFFITPVSSQINVKTGYNFSVISSPGLDGIISGYNDQRNYTDDFRLIRWLHGFEAGVRFKTGMHALEATYQAGYQGLKATGQSVDGTFIDKLKFAIHSGGIGYQVSDNIWGAGADIQYQFYKVRFIPGSVGDAFKNVQRMWAMKFYLMATLSGGKGVDIAIQPYYVLPFSKYDLSPLGEFLQVEPMVSSDRLNRFGISILFYNGSK